MRFIEQLRRIVRRRHADVAPQTTPRETQRRGSALILTLVLTLSLASLATSAVYLGGNSTALATSFDRERDLRYAAEAMLQMGKSTLNYDPLAVPDSGYRVVKSNVAITGADNLPIPSVTGSLYIGPTSSNTGQFGKFVSVVAVVQNGYGATVVRRLEEAQESFAKFAYWSNSETNNGSPIYFNNNDQLWGPVWSNDQINIGSGGAHFHGTVGTAMTVAGANYGVFDVGYSQNQKPISLPSNTVLANLAGYASAGNFSFTAANVGVSSITTRIEFVARPFNGGAGGDSSGMPINGVDDGYFRVYVSKGGAGWLRGDFSQDNCGAAYVFKSGTKAMFVPMSEHFKGWFIRALLLAPGYNQARVDSVSNTAKYSAAVLQKNILSQSSARCYPGGDPNLRAVELRSESATTTTYKTDTLASRNGNGTTQTSMAMALAGTDTTFYAGNSSTNTMGYWVPYTGTVDSRLTALWPNDAPYLYPLYRGMNPGTKGVIYVNGSVGLSGQLRGRVTLYATGNIAILRDIKYVTDPSLNLCADMLGVIAGNNIMIADNAMQDPVNITGSVYKNMDDTPDVWIQGVLMALSTSFQVENYSTGPTNANGCQGVANGRGCIYLTGGVIQQSRGPVGQSNGTGFTKRYSYDQCALYNPPPYFPTTGRYTDNRYYELDPNGFNVASLYSSLTP